MKNLKVEKNVAVFEAFYPLNLNLFGVKRGFNCSIPFYKIHGSKLFLVNWVRVGTSNSLQYLIGFKSNTVKIYSVVQSVKLLLALSIQVN